MSTRAQLPFAFARDHQVVLSEGALVAGPEATPTGLREALRRAFDAPVDFTQLDADAFQDRLMAAYQGHGQDGPEEVEAQDSVVLDDSSLEAPPTDLLDTGSDAPVIRLVNHFLRRAVEAQASDLHVEPHEGGLRARIRVDGTLQTIYDRAGAPARRVISRLKVMAGLDIAETRLPQDGHIALRYGGRSIDVRVSTLPGNYGERVVMRVLDKTAGLMPLADLGLRPAQVAELEALSAAPHGIVLAAGPTGAGKTTTLYSLLKLANQAERNILTVEDPIEYDLPGINQSQIHAEIGLTFAAGLRAALRQDPDIILVGEIRDQETSSVAAQAALTGHLVFSSVHANSSVAAIIRLRDLGLEDYLIAATVRAIIAQRLLRQLCPACRRAAPPDAVARAAFDAVEMSPPAEVFHAEGCPECNGSGYAGRAGIYEIATVTDALRAAIDEGAPEQRLKALALTPQQTLLGEALRLVSAGTTDFREVARVVGTSP
ncbi:MULTISPECIES: GspE/PulE family protein [Marinovum]|uniref:GspE/PulE family protein n=1 Tax=Marinovum TaxID=367771 RepID=UPI00065B0F9F|nr:MULTISPECIES: GspE/PulE family protein [Marinovum]AKO95925.1 Type II secretory pathway, ATPase PulE [Marinovum algicola DG 898]MDD9742692.1 GspE/PulE family protein [Marinovum sp. PR37]